MNLMISVIADLGEGVSIFDQKKQAGRHVLAHAATVRCSGLAKAAYLNGVNAPNLPRAETTSFLFF